MVEVKPVTLGELDIIIGHMAEGTCLIHRSEIRRKVDGIEMRAPGGIICDMRENSSGGYYAIYNLWDAAFPTEVGLYDFYEKHEDARQGNNQAALLKFRRLRDFVRAPS